MPLYIQVFCIKKLKSYLAETKYLFFRIRVGLNNILFTISYIYMFIHTITYKDEKTSFHGKNMIAYEL